LKRRRPPMGQDTRLKDADAPPAAILRELEAQTTLADAGLSHNANEMTFAPDGIFELVQKRRKLVGSACQRA
jgi:hypothetical protein